MRGVDLNTFKNQIKEDIKEYQKLNQYIDNIYKDEWAFNYWILDKLYCVDEELIESKIIDYRDMGIDAFEIYEDSKEIYLIQNKYYSDETSISSEYIKNDFLIRGITALENGTYTKSSELQEAFSRLKDNDFTVYLYVYVTNNNINKQADDYIRKFNREHPKYLAKIFYLDDIERAYFSEPKQEQKNITVKIGSVNKGTILNINTEDYKLENVLDAKYVLTPVASVFNMYKEALDKDYPIFDMNIREYLGNKGINKKIYETLLDKEERKNFFYYNNGITVICDKMSSVSVQTSQYNINAIFSIQNPQIVNGCQTVNSIYEALKNMEKENLEREFKDTFVMLKILQIDNTNPSEKALYRKIVKYNNSQNSIDEKTFVANNDIFKRLQTDFEKKGFLLLLKQSDKNKFASNYKSITKLKAANSKRLERFGINESKAAKDLFIPIEKLLQVITAFTSGGYKAYVKKSNMLKYESDEYNNAINFIKNGNVTIDTLLDLYLLYKRAEQEKKQEEEKRTPIPYYLIDCFAKYECDERSPEKISVSLANKEKISNIIKLYKATTRGYAREYNRRYDIDYNKMIKRSIEYDIIKNARDMAEAVMR